MTINGVQYDIENLFVQHTILWNKGDCGGKHIIIKAKSRGQGGSVMQIELTDQEWLGLCRTLQVGIDTFGIDT